MGKRTDLLVESQASINYWADTLGLTEEDGKEIDSIMTLVLAKAMLYGRGTINANQLAGSIRKALLAGYQLGKNS